MKLQRSPLLVLLGLALAAGATLWGCGRQDRLGSPFGVELSRTSTPTAASSQALRATMDAQMRATPALLRTDGVVGTATGVDASGRPVILVLTERGLGAGRLPAIFEGVRVVEQVTGKIVAMKGHGGTSHTAKQTPPIQLGTSGGPVEIANGYCCGGTLGSLVHKGTTQYILSNSHVLCGDVVSGGNGRVSTIGDDITQPSIIEFGCSSTQTEVVADLSSLSTIYPPNSTPNVDCAIAQVRSGQVRTDGAILEIGTLSAQTLGASVGLGVNKSGRTTGLTRSSISGINATVSVGYTDECAGNSFTKTYTGQILIGNSGSRFLNSGDSGSLMVEDVNSNPRSVGLLYAGSSSIAVANPIGDVLSQLGASMVGQ